MKALFWPALVAAWLCYGWDRETRVMFIALPRLRRALPLPAGQLCQDAFVLSRCDASLARYFVDLGASEPIAYSNTYCLQQAGWRGLLVDANPYAAAALQAERAGEGVVVFHRAVSPDPGVADLVEYGPLSSLVASADSDIYGSMRTKRLAAGNRLSVVATPPGPLLDEAAAPREIGYLSIDLEGMDAPVVEAFPFDTYSVRIATVEHNFDPEVQRILDETFAAAGLRRVCRRWSGIDAWYVAAPSQP